MTQKIADSNPNVSLGGRLRDYWAIRGWKQKRSSFVTTDRKEIDIQALLDQYKLKGFEFGRYVNNEDRYDFVLGAKESIAQLSGLMKTTNIGINGNIGVAFGARGNGGSARAHYEPYLNMINLTKKKGDGALAHEYGHALDYNIGMYVDQNKSYSALSGGRSTAKDMPGNTGGTCRLLMRKLIWEIKTTPSFQRLKKASEYWHYNTEVFARFFEQWCCYTLRQTKQSNPFLTESWTSYTTGAEYLTEADFKKVLPTANRLMKNIGLVLEGKPTERYIELDIVNPEKVKKQSKTKATQPKKASITPKPKKEPKPKARAAAKLAYQDYDKALKALDNFASRDKIRPTLNGVYHDNGDMVATDAHVLAVIHDAKYPKLKDGKIIAAHKFTFVDGSTAHVYQPGDTIPGKYANWSAVFPGKRPYTETKTKLNVKQELEKVNRHLANEKKLVAEVKTIKDWQKEEEFRAKHRINQYNFIPYQLGTDMFNAKLVKKVMAFLTGSADETFMCQYTGKGKYGRNLVIGTVFRSNNLEALLMPVFVND